MPMPTVPASIKPSNTAQAVGIPAMGYYLPPTRQSVGQVVDAGQAISDAAKLTQLGFDSIRVANGISSEQMAVEAVRDLQRRSGFDLKRIDVIVYAGALATSSVVVSDDQPAWGTMRDPVPLFRFTGPCLQAALGLPNASVIGIAQLACNTFQAAIRVARARIAACFPLARRAILEALEAAELRVGDLEHFIPHNLNLKSWEILAQIVGIPLAKIFTENIPRIGHVVASDNVINFLDAFDSGRIKRGDKVARFVMGFGAHWNCLVLEA